METTKFQLKHLAVEVSRTLAAQPSSSPAPCHQPARHAFATTPSQQARILMLSRLKYRSIGYRRIAPASAMGFRTLRQSSSRCEPHQRRQPCYPQLLCPLRPDGRSRQPASRCTPRYSPRTSSTLPHTYPHATYVIVLFLFSIIDKPGMQAEPGMQVEPASGSGVAQR
jgi:hypothetical protein